MTPPPRAARPTVSVIIPCWKGEEALDLQLRELSKIPGIDEVIVADASTKPDCTEAARSHGARVVRCPAPNRGSQLNAGAHAARGDVLLFHHADTELTAAHVESLRSAMTDPAVVGGAFYRKFDQRHPHLLWLEKWARRLNDWGGALYGDQSIFVRRAVFEKLGGFAPIALMEDIEFSSRLRRSGRCVLLDPPIHSSARRFLRRGAWRGTLENGALLLLFRLGVSPQRLHGWYYRQSAGTGGAA